MTPAIAIRLPRGTFAALAPYTCQADRALVGQLLARHLPTSFQHSPQWYGSLVVSAQNCKGALGLGHTQVVSSLQSNMHSPLMQLKPLSHCISMPCRGKTHPVVTPPAVAVRGVVVGTAEYAPYPAGNVAVVTRADAIHTTAGAGFGTVGAVVDCRLGQHAHSSAHDVDAIVGVVLARHEGC
jgi:hypothetical protein